MVNFAYKNIRLLIHMTRQIPLEDFFRNSERTGYQLSPDGSYISYMAPYKDRLNVFVRRVDETDEHAIRITNDSVSSPVSL